MRISKEHIEIMEEQFKLDCNLEKSIKINDSIYLAPSEILPGSRVVAGTDGFLRIISFLGKAYVMADEEMLSGWEEILKDMDADWLFRFGNLRKIDYILNEFDHEIIDTHVYFLPDADAPRHNKPENVKWFNESEIPALKGHIPFKHALCFSETQPDVIAVAKLDGEKMAAMAGASRDGKYVEQIGIDVLPEYRGQGLAVELVTELKQELIAKGELPFYGTSESHSLSRMVGIKSGFLPAFSEAFIGKKGVKKSLE